MMLAVGIAQLAGGRADRIGTAPALGVLGALAALAAYACFGVIVPTYR